MEADWSFCVWNNIQFSVCFFSEWISNLSPPRPRLQIARSMVRRRPPPWAVFLSLFLYLDEVRYRYFCGFGLRKSNQNNSSKCVYVNLYHDCFDVHVRCLYFVNSFIWFVCNLEHHMHLDSIETFNCLNVGWQGWSQISPSKIAFWSSKKKYSTDFQKWHWVILVLPKGAKMWSFFIFFRRQRKIGFLTSSPNSFFEGKKGAFNSTFTYKCTERTLLIRSGSRINERESSVRKSTPKPKANKNKKSHLLRRLQSGTSATASTSLQHSRLTLGPRIAWPPVGRRSYAFPPTWTQSKQNG